MKWYFAQNEQKNVREVVFNVPIPRPIESRFGMMFLGTKYHVLRSNVWVTGLFRMDNDPGPYLLLRADGYIDQLKNESLRVAFCFYRMKAGGLFAIFVDFPELNIPDIPSSPYVLFEMIRGIDYEDVRQRIQDTINRPQIHICFAEGDGPGEHHPDGSWSGSAINASFDILIDIDDECREVLNREWRTLLNYHNSISSVRQNYQSSIQQMQRKNPLSQNPIIIQSEAVPPIQKSQKKWWQFWKRDKTIENSTDQISMGTKIAYPSKVLPNFPLTPMHDFVKGTPIMGKSLANVSMVGLCICEVFMVWKEEMVKDEWPEYADGELKALFSTYGLMQTNVPADISHDIDRDLVQELAWKYLKGIKSTPKAYEEFLEAHLTLLGLTIDFGNTIGYGGVLQTALHWYERML